MKMRTVIEEGRSASPLINSSLAESMEHVDACGQLLSAVSMITNDGVRSVMMGQCVKCLEDLEASLSKAISGWKAFDGVLGGYKYKFRKPAKSARPQDLPGQQTLFLDPGDEVTV